MTLHEAINIVLEKNEGMPMSLQDVADRINQKELYLRKDGQLVPAYQIKLRILNYPHLFKLEDGVVTFQKKQGLDSASKKMLKIRIWELLDILRSPLILLSPNTKLIVLSILLYSRRKSKDSKYFFNFSALRFPNYFINEVIDEMTSLETGFNFKLSETKEQLRLVSKSIGEDSEEKFGSLLTSLYTESRSLSDQTYEEIISDFLYENDKSSGRMYSIGVAFQPIYNLLVRLVNGEASNIFNPCIGYGNIETAFSRFIGSKQLNITGFDINQSTIETSFLNLLSHNLNNLNLIEKDSFGDKDDDQANYDLALANIPFNLKFKDQNLMRYGDWNWLKIMINKTSNIGQVASVFPIGPLFHTKFREYRKELISENNIRAIIGLPSQIQENTSILTSIILIDKSTKWSSVYFADFSSKMLKFNEEEFELLAHELINGFTEGKDIKGFARQVKVEEIIKNDYNLNPSLYIHEKHERLEKELSDPRNSFKTLRELTENYICGKVSGTLNELEYENNSETLAASLVRVSDLTKHEGESYLSHKDLGNFGLYKGSFSKYLVPDDSILVTLLGNNLKPIIYRKGNKKVLLGNEVVAIVPSKTLVDIDYLNIQLKSELTTIQFEMLKKGTVINKISINDLLNIRLLYIPLKDQKAQVKALKSVISTYPSNSQEISIHETRLLSSIKHSINQNLSAVRSNMGSLELYLQRKIEKSESVSWDDPIKKTPSKSGGDRTIKDVFKRITSSLDLSTSTFDKIDAIIKLNKSELNFVKTDLKDFIVLETMKINADYPEVNFHIGGDHLNLNIDQWSFNEIIKNLVENALRHGYPENNNNKNIVFEIVINEDKSSVSIHYYNDGGPFDDNFTFEDFIESGQRSGNKGTGYGGYIIDRIIKCHNGLFEDRKTGNIKKYPDGIDRSVGVYFEIIIPLKL